MPVPLQYRGPAGVDGMNAFNARTSITWKGELLFRVYPYEGKLYFIKIGGAKNHQAAIHFGLVGAIWAYFANKRNARKTQELLSDIAGATPDQLLPLEKVNHVIEIDEITEPAINPRSFWSPSKFGSFTFRNAKGKKKTYTFDDGANFQAGVDRLTEALGDRLAVKAKWDDLKAKVLKVE